MNRIEDRLRDAFGAAADMVGPESLGGLRARSPAPARSRLAPLAAAAAVTLVLAGASVFASLALSGTHPARPASGLPPPTPSASQPGGTAMIVPDVIGMSAPTASAVLQAAGLRVVVAARSATAVPAGTVITQAPAAGSRVPPGATVTLTVAQVAGAPAPGQSGTGEPTRLVTAAGFAVTIAIPQSWQPARYLGSLAGYQGVDGWVQVSAATERGGVQAACTAVAAQSAGRPYGSDPQISYRSIDGRPGCLILPSGDAPVVSWVPGGAGLPRCSALVAYRQPLGGRNFLLISADPPHLIAIVDSVQLHH